MPIQVSTIIEPIQEGSGDPSPDNIRPISGHTGAKLTKCGKNLLKLDETVNQTKGGITFTANPDGTITLSGKATSDVYKIIVDRLNVPDGDYILTGCPSGAVDLNYILYVAPSTSSNRLDTGNGVSFSVDNRQTYNVTIRVLKGTDVTGLVFKPMVRLATETDATYEPYQVDTFSLDFGQTVYGGTMDWNTGVLTVDRGIYSFTGSENIMAVNIGASDTVQQFNMDDLPTNMEGTGDEICNEYQYHPSVTGGTVTGFKIYLPGFIVFGIPMTMLCQYGNANKNDSNSLKEAAKTYFTSRYNSGTPVQICYKLATPYTIQLSPAQIKSLKGVNTIYSTEGSSVVTFNKDVLDYSTTPVSTAQQGSFITENNGIEGYGFMAKSIIEPQQSGSGEPYPAGGGKNLIPFPYVDTTGTQYGLTMTVNNDCSITTNGTPTTQARFTLVDNYVLQPGTYTLSGFDAALNVRLDIGIYDTSWNTIAFINESKKTVTFTITEAKTVKINIYFTASNDYSGVCIRPQLEVGSVATAYAPYANVRPISGHTEAKLARCGKNLAEQIVYGYVTLDGNNAYVRIDNNSISVIAGVVEGNEYTISCGATFDRFGIGKLEVDNPTNGALLTGYRFYGNQSSVHELHFTAEFTGTAFIYLKSTKDETAKDSLQVEIGSVATEYTPYQGETFTANFGQNVYGGTLDWGKGVLTVDRAIVTLTGTENVQFSSGGVGRFVYYGLQNVIKPFSNSAIVAPIVCSHYKPSTAEYLYNTPDAYAIAQNNGTEIWFSDTGFDSPSAFKAYLSAQNAAGTPVQVCYKLATPTTIQLTPAQLTALQGMNNIWCDAGETTVSGRKDILWLTNDLINQIAELRAAIISLGGNV